MPNKTDLNVTPYYDDFDKTKNFQQILSRPAYAVQARELTQMQSMLTNQIETLGNFNLAEGTMVIPGALHIISPFAGIEIQSTFGNEDVDVTNYPAESCTLTGLTSGVQALVLHGEKFLEENISMIYVRYIKVGTDNVTAVFQAGESISADVPVTHGTTVFSVGIPSMKAGLNSPDKKATVAQIEAGVYWIRGHFVETPKSIALVSSTTPFGSGRVGFTLTETIVTPEIDSTLLDNASGTSNYAAKGSHRLKTSVTLKVLPLGSVDDDNFIELATVISGRVQNVNKVKLGGILEKIAARTYEESGNYTIRPFTFQVKESVTLNENEGVYKKGETTRSGGTASTDILALKVSPGKAYISGHEVEKIVSNVIDIPKARDFNSVNTSVTTYDIGNFLNITNVYGSPDVSFISGETTPYKQISLFDTETVTRGTSSGTRIGVARARTIEYFSGTSGATTSSYKLFLFDFRPFTIITLSGTPSPTLEATHSSGGVQVKGVSSNATGWVFADGTGSDVVILTNVSGKFVDGEKITASDSAESDQIVETSGNVDITINRTIVKNVSECRQVFMSDVDGGQNFSADIILDTLPTTESYILLDSTDAAGADVEDHIISELDKIPMGIERGATGGTGSSLPLAKLKFPEKNIGLYKMNKENIKTHLIANNQGISDTSYYLRRQFVTTSSSVGVITLSAGTNEVFLSHTEPDYMITILSSGAGGTGQQGDVISASNGFSGGGTSSITITNNDVFGNGAKIKVMATLLKSSASPKTKSPKLMKRVKVSPGVTDAYGTRPTDKTISLGRADAFKLVAVLDSESTDTDATTSLLTLGPISGSFIKGEDITGSNSGASGRIISTSSPISFVYKRGTNLQFSASDVITGSSSLASANISLVTPGSANITDRFELDTGQRDNYYDISRIVRKPGVSSPLGKLLIVFDFLEHGTGDFFTVDSYVDVADRMTYEDIPKYSATKVDPDDPAPSGEYNLQDVFDLRPRAENIAGTSANIDNVDEITGNSFDFVNRQFDGTGASTINFIKPGSFITTDFEYYLGYQARLTLSINGQFGFARGRSAENPRLPKENVALMQLANVTVPPYTFKPSDVVVRRVRNRRYTMKDIGKLEERINHVEYYTSLNLLERSADSFQIQDANGLDRFKSGFVVDSFAGHSVGDVAHADYKCSIDMQQKELRPLHTDKGVSLIENLTTDAERTSAGYQKTGDLITLPYKEIVFQDQPYASRVERVTPLLLSSWLGHIELDPAGDEWFEIEYAPDLIINVEGNFDTFTQANQSAVGTVWNAWQTAWGGSSVKVIDDGITVTRQTTSSGVRTRQGEETSIVAQIDLESQGSKIIQRAFIPFCRARNITFTGTEFFPNIRLYCFFDGQEVNKYITPLSGFTTDAADVSGVVQQESPLITSATGKVQGIFSLPDPLIEGNPKFRTGEITFRLTSSTTDVRSKDPETAGNAIYQAVGILETEQETIIATRNATIATRSVSEDTAFTSTSNSVTPYPPQEDFDWDGSDPIAQTFFVEASTNDQPVAQPTTSGRFITSVDVFFSAKDENLPVFMEIRTVGDDGGSAGSSPGRKILPFGRVVKEPSEINLSDDATVATNFAFSSPVYVKDQTEYCILMGSSTPRYKVFISRMGETDIGGSRTISEQPHVGVLFKSHNARTWAPSMTEDLKFKIYCAEFDIDNDGTFTLNNDELPAKTLKNHPLTFTNGNSKLLVNHKDHGMQDLNNNVTISGVLSGAETTLAAAMDSISTSLTLTAGTDFDDTSGKFAYTTNSEWWIKIDDEIMKYSTISTNAVSSITRSQGDTIAASHAAGAIVELYMLHKIPFTEINKTFTSISNTNIDSYTVLLTSSPSIAGGTTDATNGGKFVTATENACYDTGHPFLSTLEVEDTEILTTLTPMTSTSPSGVQTSFLTSSPIDVELNENTDFDIPYMILSDVNETLENGGEKSFKMQCTLSSKNRDVSPVIDMGRSTFLAVSNRLNSIDVESDVYPTSLYDPSTDPTGDDNAAIYLTRKVSLENSATALRVLFAANRHTSAEIEMYYKILRSDDASEFDDLSYVPFNNTGQPDVATKSSTTKDNFQDYSFSAGVTDDGLGVPLDDFISFQIKIVMKGTNTAQPPRIKDLRAIALAI